MKEFKSDITEIKAAPEAVFTFLTDFNNFKHLLPEQVINWDATQTTCSFTIKNMTDLSMKIDEKIPHSLVKMVPYGKAPFTFELITNIDKVDESSCKVLIRMEANLNPMLSMMASKPLGNFVKILAEKLKEVMEGN
jgi:carbon monoxide dehydrogenase subunit G